MEPTLEERVSGLELQDRVFQEDLNDLYARVTRLEIRTDKQHVRLNALEKAAN